MNNIRITSGTLRGRKLTTPGGATHPMGERERLALFNMIAEYIPGAKVLDAFAGSGALGIEALSRGAAEATFVEKNPASAKVIRQNLHDLGLEAKVIQGDVAAVDGLGEFDLIIADPPYDNFDISRVAALVGFLKDSGVFILSHPGEAPEIKGLNLLKTRKHAGAKISIYRDSLRF